jgi:hypothetical protein
MNTKELLTLDVKASRKPIGDFALEVMDLYDNITYEIELVNATSKGRKVVGHASMSSPERINDLIEFYELQGEYYIRTIDAQKEFFNLMAEIRDDLKQE